MAAASVSQASTMAVLWLFLFLFWNVGASSVDQLYSFPEHHVADIASSKIVVLQLNEYSGRVKRQTDLGAPDATSVTGADAGPDQSNGNSDTSQNVTASTPTAQSNGSDINSNQDTNADVSNNQTDSDYFTTTTISPEEREKMEDADVTHVNHRYYTTTVQKSAFALYWSELEFARQHRTLSNGHRLAAVIALRFPFYFYGHRVTNVTVATGGFIYMSHFLHQWLTTTQYIAPLMANFDTSLSSGSNIIYESTADRFTVEWKDVFLKDQKAAGSFHFQAILNRDNSIQFLYKKLPIPVPEISNKQHPVRVGLSDAWYNDTYIQEAELMRRTIIEYHRVVLNTTTLQSGSVVVIKPLPTCNRLSDCDSCTRHENVSFNCKWCNVIGRCSDGPDWYRQHWNKRGCGDATHEDPKVCRALPPPKHVIVDPHSTPKIDKCENGQCDNKSSFPVVAVVISILIIAALVGSVVAWVYYAYTHPTSKSGMWLMEHRPSQIKAKIKFWKSSTASGAKYQTETDA